MKKIKSKINGYDILVIFLTIAFMFMLWKQRWFNNETLSILIMGVLILTFIHRSWGYEETGK